MTNSRQSISAVANVSDSNVGIFRDLSQRSVNSLDEILAYVRLHRKYYHYLSEPDLLHNNKQQPIRTIQYHLPIYAEQVY